MTSAWLQVDVFAQTAGPLISEFVVDGSNCRYTACFVNHAHAAGAHSVFTFGQTGSGKTFTMVGQPEVEGILPRTFKELFTLIDQV